MGLSVVVCIQLPASAKQTRLLQSHIRNRPAGETIYVTSDGAIATRQSTRPLGDEQLISPSSGANLDPGGAIISLLSAEANVNNL